MVHAPLISLIFVVTASLGGPVLILGGSTQFPMTLPDLVYLLGKYFALASFLILTFQYVWTAKFKFLEKLRSYDSRVAVHRTLGTLGILGVTLHPILILVFYATQGVPLIIDLPMAAGFSGLVILLFIIGSTFLGRIWNIRYETWKRLHWLTFPVLTLAFYHSIQLGSDIYGPLRTTWFILWGFHLLVVLGKIFHKLSVWRKTSRIVSAVSDTPGTLTVVAEKLKQRYQPGQFAFISLKLTKKWEAWHPFSLTSHHSDEHISMTIKKLGDFSSAAAAIKPGDRIKTDIGYGAFTLPVPGDNRYTFIAAGVGITPIYALLKDLAQKPDSPEVILIYCVHSESDILFRDELTRWFSERPAWSLHIACTSQPDWPGEQGRINDVMVDKICGPLYPGSYFLCGPAMMVKSIGRYLRIKGVSRRQIKREKFVFLP
ncbi:MAG: hypothetical protein HN368_19235 [Spirochaetales bacterium]|jgi:predicted ferric reductase|nr:hypothetical protein [Spirochaetales bacterium]